jgi:hypothetical protein
MPPVPAEPQVILPGLALAAAMNSGKLLMPILVLTTSISCTRTIRVSGAMSFLGSNGILGIRCCMMAPAEALIMPMTCPSLPALATKSTPVTPAAPLLFSTTTDWPSRGARPCAR